MRLLRTVTLLVVLLAGASGCDFRDFSDDTAQLRVLVRTTGDRPDPDGYVVASADGRYTGTVPATGGLEFDVAEEGPVEITLSGLADNCIALSPNPQTARIRFSETAELLFEINCVAVTSRLVFETDRDGNLEIYAANLNGSAPTNLTRDAGPDFDPAGALGGSRIAFTRLVGDAGDVFVMAPDGGGLRSVAPHPARDGDPALSPDGSRIAFASERDGDPELYLVDADGADLRRLTRAPGRDRHPAFSPDGRRLAFASERDGVSRIYLLRLDVDAPPVRLTDGPGAAYSPAFSPDGQSIVFVSERDGNPELYLVDADGANLRRLTDDLAPDLAPAFSPDGSLLAFVRVENAAYDVYLLGLEADAAPVNVTRSGSFDFKPGFLPLNE